MDARQRTHASPHASVAAGAEMALTGSPPGPPARSPLAAQIAETTSSGISFPYHRCIDYRNSSLPYNLEPPVEKEPGLFCTTLFYLGPTAE
eukprot:141573-Chlamydomonas_euryale.AAC.1